MATIRLAHGVWTNSGALLLSGAGAVTGATAANEALQAVGLAGMAFGLCLLAWGITINGEHWWRVIGRSAGTTESWVPLSKAVWHIVANSQWSREHSFGDWRKAEDAVRRELFEAAARGELGVRGRRRVNASEHILAAASESVPTDFWQHGSSQLFFELLSVFSPELRERPDPSRPAIWTNRARYPGAENRFYGNVVVNAAELMKRWPQAKRRWFGRPPPSGVTPAFRHYMTQEANRPNFEMDTEVERFLGHG